MSTSSYSQNAPVTNLDVTRYAGTWYSLSSIPTFLDKNWRETYETYTIRDDGDYDVITYYKKGDSEKSHTLESKLKLNKVPTNGDLTAQYFWLLRPGYRVIFLADDYSYSVVGHPKKNYLFILSRKPEMDRALYDSLVEKCRESGYDTAELVSQKHQPGIH